MMSEFNNHLEQILHQATGNETKIISAKTVGGGCINNAQKLKTTSGNYFIKQNNAVAFPGMFEAELKGLQILIDSSTIHVPKPIATGEFENISFIIIEFINSSSKNKNFWENFGRSLAKLHRTSNEYFGLDHDNYIGSLKQSNKQTKSWIKFFIDQRLKPQLKLAETNSKINSSVINSYENLFKKLPAVLREEKPSLLHGDLWSGNFMINKNGEASLIDPAVYFGNREVDLAMTKLFGGFTNEFYESYNEEWPLEKGFEDRFEIYNLYPLLVHVNLFGGGYIEQVKNILRRLV